MYAHFSFLKVDLDKLIYYMYMMCFSVCISVVGLTKPCPGNESSRDGLVGSFSPAAAFNGSLTDYRGDSFSQTPSSSTTSRPNM